MKQYANDALGQVQVWTGDPATSITLDVRSVPRFGLRLVDHSGTAVTPNSPRLGFHGRSQKQKYDIVLDNLADDYVDLLTAAGYRNVKSHG